jgi:hypothetical protein
VASRILEKMVEAQELALSGGGIPFGEGCLSPSDCVAWLLIQRAGASESELKNQKYAQVVIPPHIS